LLLFFLADLLPCCKQAQSCVTTTNDPNLRNNSTSLLLFFLADLHEQAQRCVTTTNDTTMRNNFLAANRRKAA
jgi:hypothetical protein